MAVSKIRADIKSQNYASDTVKTWFNSTYIDFSSDAIASIYVVNNIAFVRLEGLKVKQSLSSLTKVINGQMPKALQSSYVQFFNDSNTKSATVRMYPGRDLYILTTGYNANEELPRMTFSYPLSFS